MNSILEIIHQVNENLVRTFDLQNIYLDKDGQWSVILDAMYLAVRSTYHITLQSTPCQLVIGRNMLLNTTFVED